MDKERGEVDENETTTRNAPVRSSDKKLHRTLLIVVGAALVVGAVIAAVVIGTGSGGSGSDGSKNDSSSSGGACSNTADASVISVVEGSDGYRTFTANGCPDYDTSGETTPNTATQKEYIVKLPIAPKISTSKTYIGVYRDKAETVSNSNVPLGPVGLAVNGVVLYGNGDAKKRDAYESEGQTFDQCKGHSDPTGAYHYHAEPDTGCVYTDTLSQHSPLYGVMIDGIPIFGVYGDNGNVPTDLDECNGHTDSTYPFYHYHVQANYQYPYLINCLSGCIDYESSTSDFLPRVNVATSCSESSTQYDYSPMSALIQDALT